MKRLSFFWSAAALILGLLGVGNAQAQCSYNINYGCWFTEQTNVRSISWDEQGTKLALQTNSGQFCGTFDNNTVLNMGPGAVSRNPTLSKNLSLGSYPGDNHFGPNGGIFLGSHGAVGRYVKPSGAVVSLAEAKYASASSIDRDIVVYLSSPITNGNIINLNYANVADPENPVFTQIPLSSPLNGGNLVNALFGEGIATAGDRIYIAMIPGNVNDPTIVKCVNFSGATCPNWSDVTISTGGVSDIGIRPTDGMIFARTNKRSGQAAQPGGMVIFNQNGQLATDFNHTDLSLITPAIDGTNLVRFDAAGNIFANLPIESGGVSQGIGIYKFDPKGNLDLSFMRNVTNSYIYPGVAKVYYFDVNPVSGELAISTFTSSAGEFGLYHALAGGNHTQQNNEMWKTGFQTIGSGDGAAVGVGVNSGYNALHILYNNGKLKVQGETTAFQAENCGVKDPKILPPTTDGVGTIDCSKTTFLQAPTAGVASSISMVVTVNVTAAGEFAPVTVSGSGMSLQDPHFTVVAQNTGVQQFIIPISYNGSALGQFDFTVGAAGSCTADLSDMTKKTKAEVEIWTLEKCSLKIAGPQLK